MFAVDTVQAMKKGYVIAYTSTQEAIGNTVQSSAPAIGIQSQRFYL